MHQFARIKKKKVLDNCPWHHCHPRSFQQKKARGWHHTCSPPACTWGSCLSGSLAIPRSDALPTVAWIVWNTLDCRQTCCLTAGQSRESCRLQNARDTGNGISSRTEMKRDQNCQRYSGNGSWLGKETKNLTRASVYFKKTVPWLNI